MKNICDWQNCNEPGEFKAPAEKDGLSDELIKLLLTNFHESPLSVDLNT